MRAVVVERPGAVSVTTTADPEIGRDDVLIRVNGCGICGTDLHIVEHGIPTIRYPVVPGHESWGEVVEVGTRGDLPVVGQFVAIDPSLHCGVCGECRRGCGNLCERWGSIGGTRNGAWADLVAVPGRNVHVLRDDYPTELAVAIEPVACLIRGMRLVAPEAGRTALVFGAGTMGTLWALALRIAGVRVVGVVETLPERRALCEALFDLPVVAPDASAGLEADYVIDATGSLAAMEEAVWHARPGGTVMFFGVTSEGARIAVPPFRLYQRELRILSSMAIVHSFGDAVSYVAEHGEALRPVVTNVFGLADFKSALSCLAGGRALKVALNPRFG
ncbi:MAG: alcohol dehydrogenase catalytic domain-containing protein [Actinomycetota bacterium]|nr:alcohol dehydrogenase catalytic domain-containing protein [Actinomycetota bacterium]